jgi:hypothetical protein
MSSNKITPDQENWVHQFAYAADAIQRQDALRSLVRTKAIHKLCLTPPFEASVRHIADMAISGENDIDRLIAISQISRIHAVVKKLRTEYEPILRNILLKPVPVIDRKIEAEDRYYVARSLEFADKTWARDFLVDAILAEESAEKYREECVRVFLGFVPDISELLKTAYLTIERRSPLEGLSSDSVARRLKRVFHAISVHALNSNIGVSDAFGEQLNGLLRLAFRKSGHPTEFEVRRDLANVVLTLIHESIRANFSLSSQPNTYLASSVLRSWFIESQWPSSVETAVADLEADIGRSFVILAKQGVADNELLKQLKNLSGSNRRAMMMTTSIADNNEGIPSNLDQWLRKLGSVQMDQSSELMAESSMLSLDQNLAFLLLETISLNRDLSSHSEVLATALRVFEPLQSDNFEKIVAKSRTIIDDIEAMSRKRSLRIRGNVGDVVEYTSSEHEISRPEDFGERYVCIIRPGVERSKSGRYDVVIKALVEASEAS